LTSRINARVARPFLIAICLAWVTAAAQQGTPSPVDPPAQTRTETQPQRKPAKNQEPSRASPKNRARAAKDAIPPTGTPKKTVVRQGGVAEPTAQIVAGMTAEEADRQRREAELLLSTTEEKLKEIAPRQFDTQQEETVAQIHNYMEGSRTALKQGDVSRAHTLALKAGLLADDLASH